MSDVTGGSERRRAWVEEAHAVAASCRRLRAMMSREPSETQGGPVEAALRLLERAETSLERAAGALELPAPPPPPTRSERDVESKAVDAADPLVAYLVRWAEALLQGDLASCAELAQWWPHSLRQYETVRDLLRKGADALAAERWTDALPAVRLLTNIVDTGSGLNRGDGSASQRRLALLHITAARLELRGANLTHAGNAGNALKRAMNELLAARSLAEDQAPYQAALSEYHLHNGELVHAEERALAAAELDPGHPAGHVAAGRCAEAQGDDPREQYAQAVEAAWSTGDPVATLAEALSPMPPLLLHMVADRALGSGDGGLALTVVDHALEAWQEGESEDARWRRLAAHYSLRARALELSRAPADEQVTARVNAAEHYAWSNDLAPAQAELQSALFLDPDHAQAHYLLADVLRTASTRPQHPYVDVDVLRQAVIECERALALEPALDAWRQRVRTSIAEYQANLAGAAGSNRLWEAACHLEEALVQDPDDAWSYRGLGRLYGQLELYSCGLRAIDRVAELDADDPAVWDQRALLFTNAGRYDEALATLPHIEDQDWAESVRAAILVDRGRQEDLGEALNIFEAAAGSPDAPLWVWSYLIDAYGAAGRADSARTAAQGIVDARQRYEPLDRDGTVTMASALMVLGRCPEALELLTLLSGDPTGRARRLRKRAACRLALGEVGAAAELYEGIESERASSEWTAVLNDLDLVERLVPEEARDEVAGILAQARRLVRRRRAERPDRRSAERELRDLLDAPRVPPEARVAVLAGLSRLARETRDWESAVAHAISLRDQLPGGLGASTGALLGRLLRDEGDDLLARGDPGAAIPVYSLAIAVLGEGQDQGGNVAGLRVARAAATMLAGGQPTDEEIASVVRGLSSDPAEAAALLAQTTAPLLKVTDDFWRIVDAWSALAGRSSDPLVRAAAAAAVQELDPALGRIFDGDDWIEEPAPLRPLTIELGAALVPEDTGPGWPLFAEAIPWLQESVERDLGIILPDVLVRAADDLAPDEYALLIDDAVFATGHLDRQAPRADELAALTPVVEHLRSVILQNTDAVFGVEEFEMLLTAELQDAEGAMVAKLVDRLPDTVSRVRWARVLGRLVAEGVSIAGWATELLDAVAGQQIATSELDALEDRLRLTRRKLLPGNRRHVQRFRLPPEWDNLLKPLSPDGGAKPAPVSIHDVLRDLSSWYAEQDAEVAVVADSPAARRRFRALTRSRTPGLHVLAGGEIESLATLPLILRGPVPATVDLPVHQPEPEPSSAVTETP